MFNALVVNKDDEEFTAEVKQLEESDLPEGDVLIDVEYSTINYKDGLAVTNSSPIVRNWPMVPGIDLAGTVAESSNPEVSVGEKSFNKWMGELEKKLFEDFRNGARVQGAWTIPVPKNFTTAQTMAIGTAGYTSMLSVLALEEHGITPEAGPILVTGASGGVGSIVIALLSAQGYEVHASTGRTEEAEYLTSLGASTIIDRQELSEQSKRPLMSTRWAGAIDAVGSHTLANVLAAIEPSGALLLVGWHKAWT